LSPTRILVVDDESEFLDITVKALTVCGYETVGALTGVAGVELCRSFLPHLILLDVMMPEVNGIETLRRIREFDRAVKVVMISGMHDLQAAREAIQLGAADYLTKPFDLKELDAYIKEIIESPAEWMGDRNGLMSH